MSSYLLNNISHKRNDTMLNINSKLQTLFARGGATGGTIIPARQSVARLTTVLFVVMSAMFILTGCGLGSLIKAVNSGNLPCNINPFQEMCYPTPRVVVEREKIELLENLTPEQIKQRERRHSRPRSTSRTSEKRN